MSLLIKEAEKIFSETDRYREAGLKQNNDCCFGCFSIAGKNVKLVYDREILKDYFFWQMKLFALPDDTPCFATVYIWSDGSMDSLYSAMEQDRKEKTVGISIFENDPVRIFIKNNKNVGKVTFAWRESTKEGWVNIHPDSLQRFMDISHMLTPLFSRMFEHNGTVLLHSAAIEYKGNAVLLTGLSGSGKSTLSAACLHEGLNFISDDTVLFRTSDNTVFPMCTTIHLAPDALNIFPKFKEKIDSGEITTSHGRGEKKHLDISCYKEQVKLTSRADLVICPVINEDKMPEIKPGNKNSAITALLVSSAALLGEKRNPSYLSAVAQKMRQLDFFEYSLSGNIILNVEYLKRFLIERYGE